MSQEKKTTVGPPIWVESLLSNEEYAVQAKKYSATYGKSKPTPFFRSDFEWRRNMGKRLSEEEAKMLNDRIDVLRKLITEEKNTIVYDGSESETIGGDNTSCVELLLHTF